MRKEWNKNIVRVGLIVSFLAINALLLFGISSVFSYLNTGADRSSMLHLASPLKNMYLPKIDWTNLENPGRPMEEHTLQKIEKDYLSSWYIRNQAYLNNENHGIDDYFTESAREKIYKIIAINKANNTSVNTTTITHYPELEFYSSDGKLVVFTDNNVLSYSEVFTDNKLVVRQRERNTYQIMMLLEDGFWRIRQMVEIQETEDEAKKPKHLLDDLTLEVQNGKGLNYYPKDCPWDMFGPKYNDSIIDSDFRLLHGMGFNTIRVFVPFESFGKANIDPEKLEQLEKTLNIAQIHKLKVIITLFDFYGDYGIQNWTLTHRHAEQIVSRLKNHSALLAWDIKNEPDLDFESRGQEKVLAWLQQMIFNINQWDNTHPVTIGWSSPEAAIHLSDEVDFVSFHYYRKVSDFAKAFKTLKKKVSQKPLVLQEFGYSSYDGIWNAYLGSEDDQATYFEEMQNFLKKDSIPFLFWTLYDFEEIPTSVVGRLPWRKARQKHFGILDANGDKKAAFHILSNDH